MTEQEKIIERLKSLYKLYHDRDDEFQKAKLKRMIFTLLFFTVAYFVILIWITKQFWELNWGIIAIIFISSIVLSWIHFWVNATVFGQLANKGRDETEILERIKEDIRELEKKLEE